jgi:sugar phosphate isomerase/epimerase
MKAIKGPAIFLAQFAGDADPFNNLGAIARWAAGHGFKGVQIPSWSTSPRPPTRRPTATRSRARWLKPASS